MDQHNEPLARRLRDAAIDRAETNAERVDDFVIDNDGVLDLRDLDRDPLGTSIADPARALAAVRGRLGDAHEVSDLYDDEERPRPRWRLGLRARHAYGSEVPSAPREPLVEPTPPVSNVLPPLSRLTLAPLAGDDAHDDPLAAPADDDAVTPAAIVAGGSEIDLRDDDRPTADCPKCMGLGRRDLFDRFSQVEFYSCDSCSHMWQQDVR